MKDAGDEEEKGRCDEGSKEGTGGRRSKRDRRSRRKTNSECSPTPRPSITSDPGISSEEQARTASVGENHQSSSVEDGSSHLEGKSSPRPNYKREDSILSVGGKPKVVVPSPKGRTNRTICAHFSRYSKADTESKEPGKCSVEAEQR